MPKKHPSKAPGLPPVPRGVGLGIFALALALRALFGAATPDWSWPASAAYKADAYTWLEYARALQQGQRFELGLPLRPPGMAYWVALLWNGQAESIPELKLVWCLLGALAVYGLYRIALRDFGFTVAALAGLLAAGSSGLLMLSTSLNNETPYLVLALAALAPCSSLAAKPRGGRLALWSVLNALACLVRVEHLLFFGLALLFLLARWCPGAEARVTPLGAAARLALCVSLFAITLAPWHFSAWAAIDRFNTEPPEPRPQDDAVHQRLEQLLAGRIHWSEPALAERARLPAFCRRTAANFVAATLAWRGAAVVQAEDFEILEQAFGVRPRPLDAHPFIALYGPLNFYLANNAAATGGFSRAALDRPPPLAGGAARYPAPLIQGLPPQDLSLVYPPHLEVVLDGYAMGWRWIREHPADYLRLAWHKLRIFWAGAALGFTGTNLPLGLAGLRRSADLVVPHGAAASAWQLAMLAAGGAGIAAGWRRSALIPWLLLLASKVAVTLAFFGYARQGALLIPVVCLLVALAAERFIPPLRAADSAGGRLKLVRGLAGAALLMLGLETIRFISPPSIWIDGQPAGPRDPIPIDQHRDRIVELR